MDWKIIHRLARASTRATTVASLLMLGSLAYSVIYWSSPPKPWSAEKKESLPLLRALLFKSNQQIDLYRIIKSKDTYQLFSFTGSVLPSKNLHSTQDVRARILSDTSAIIDDGSASPRMIGPTVVRELALPLLPQRLVHGLDDHSKFFYSTIENDMAILYIHSPTCEIDQRVVIGAVHHDVEKSLEDINVPPQRALALSPLQNTLAFLDHTSSARMTLVNLITREITSLRVPDFGGGQLHFSPSFYDENTLLFSAIEGNQWGTVLYDIPHKRYQLFSKNFTDRVLHSASGGQILLQQSFYGGGAVNIPFGSLALRNQDKAFLALPTTEQGQSGIVRIFKTSLDGQRTEVGTQTFQANPVKGYFEYTEEVGPLLTALDLPSSLIREYERRRKEVEARGDSYVLVDAFSQ